MEHYFKLNNHDIDGIYEAAASTDSRNAVAIVAKLKERIEESVRADNNNNNHNNWSGVSAGSFTSPSISDSDHCPACTTTGRSHTCGIY